MESRFIADAEAMMMNSPCNNPLRPESDLNEGVRADLASRSEWEDLLRQVRALRGLSGARVNYVPIDPDHPDARAHKLLLRLLTPEQRDEYEAYRRITIHIGEGEKKRRYELRYRDLQIKVFDHTGRLIENWCAYIPYAPREDTLVGQLLALWSDPDRLRRSAQVMLYSREGYPRATLTPEREQAPAIPRYRRALELMRRAGYAITLTPS